MSLARSVEQDMRQPSSSTWRRSEAGRTLGVTPNEVGVDVGGSQRRGDPSPRLEGGVQRDPFGVALIEGSVRIGDDEGALDGARLWRARCRVRCTLEASADGPGERERPAACVEQLPRGH